MNIDVTTNKVKVDTSYIANKNEYNVTTCNFTFSEEYSGLVKQAIFEAGKIAKQVDIINGECDIPYEILTSGYDKVLLRVYAYELNQSDELVLRYSPSPDNFFLNEGSYVLNMDVEPITPTQYEIYTAKLEAGLQQAQNVDIDAEQTSEGAVITITNRNAERKMVEVHNGRDGEKGDTGEQGPAGADGKDGEDATINGENTINIVAGENITISQQDSTLTISSEGGSGTIDYTDLENKPSINNVTLTGNKTTSDLGIVIPDVTGLGDNLAVSINSSTYVMTMQLKHGTTVLSTGTVDLPLESVVVNGSYDSVNKKIVLTLQSGSTIDVPVGDLISGLQSEITSNNKLASDLVDDSNSTNKFVTASDKTTWNAKYDKPSGGIPSTDLSSAVQTSLGKADTALQSEIYTGTITSVKMNGSTIASSGEADLGTVITQHQDISGKEDKTNKVTSISSSSTDTQYPSAKCVYDLIGNINTILATLTIPNVNNGGN